MLGRPADPLKSTKIEKKMMQHIIKEGHNIMTKHDTLEIKKRGDWKRFMLMVTLLLIPIQAKSACFADAEGVRHHSPDAWVSWTYQMKGHIGEKCYFPTTKSNKKWNPKMDLDSRTDSGAAASVPIPKPDPIRSLN